MSRLLIIDDDEVLAGLFRDYLSAEQFDVTIRHNATDGLYAALSGDYDLLVLDVMLPDMPGTEVLRQLREQSNLPVLMFTAKGDDVDRILGLESGADDYVPKPCTPRELSARIKAILRRTDNHPDTGSSATIKVGPLEICPQQRRAVWHGQTLDVTSTEFSLLETLARHAGQVVSKNALSEAALGRPLARFDRSIDVHMSSIRQKLGRQTDGHTYIQTVRGKGYQLIK